MNEPVKHESVISEYLSTHYWWIQKAYQDEIEELKKMIPKTTFATATVKPDGYAYCYKCGKQVFSEDIYCRTCGSDIDWDQALSDIEKIWWRKAYCECHAIIRPENVFCPQCGVKLNLERPKWYQINGEWYDYPSIPPVTKEEALKWSKGDSKDDETTNKETK